MVPYGAKRETGFNPVRTHRCDLAPFELHGRGTLLVLVYHCCD